MREDHAVRPLKNVMDQFNLTTFSMPLEGNGFDKMPWNTLEVKVPLEGERLQIMKECQDSTVGGQSQGEILLAGNEGRCYKIRKNL